MNTTSPSIRFEQAGSTYQGQILQGKLGAMVLQGEVPPVGQVVRFSVCGSVFDTRDIGGVGKIMRTGNEQSRTYGIKLMRITSGDGIPALKEFLRDVLKTEFSEIDPAQVIRIGNFWSVVCDPTDPDAALPQIPKLTESDLLAFFQTRSNGHAISVYLKTTVTYLTNSVPFHGRAVRINEVELIVNTNLALPGLGQQTMVQIPVTVDGIRSYVVVRGSVQRRSDQREDAVWKGRFDLRIFDVEEIEFPGIFFKFLEQNL
ncbi:MAG: hypothetical protein HUU55_19640 [Myxococcales bacterium]|nr:hypothetical protein [Myxococcales bacterium]